MNNQMRKVLNFLKCGKTLSEKQAKKMLKVKSLRKVVSMLREDGRHIVSDKTSYGRVAYRKSSFIDL